ncbi:MAG: hypothetical protein JF597_24290 [Streptomyces sp.]|uniref:hypothetical protein n=1 Tax=Streptomyces sp. TaxID=1931 RepID=UPI0025FFFA94|nr:hypothetical protein [Streptomyces sp.]MBW8796604.1 hypothetical protein [Streptomyces sp.]
MQLVKNAGGIPVGLVSAEEKAGLLRPLGCDVVINRSGIGPGGADALTPERTVEMGMDEDPFQEQWELNRLVRLGRPSPVLSEVYPLVEVAEEGLDVTDPEKRAALRAEQLNGASAFPTCEVPGKGKITPQRRDEAPGRVAFTRLAWSTSVLIEPVSVAHTNGGGG